MVERVQSSTDQQTMLRSDKLIARTISLLDRLFPPPRHYNVRLWDQLTIPATDASSSCNGTPAFTMVLNHPGALRRMLTPPIERGLGEAYIYGDFDLEGDILAATGLIDVIYDQHFTPLDAGKLVLDLLRLPSSSRESPGGRGAARMQGALHSQQRDQEAIHYHYDVGNDFYSLWLDQRMQYSCAYFITGTEDLDTAQEQKLHHICRKLRLKPGERLLDIGCGWGGLSLFAAENYGADVLGITLSQEQARLANEQITKKGVGDRVQVLIKDYRDLGGLTFEKIVSVGMFEHVGRLRMPEYFHCAFKALKPGGLFLNHGISHTPIARQSFWGRWVSQHILGYNTFSQRYFFPDGELLPVSEVNLFAEQGGFEVRDVENLREHYALTLQHWVHNMEKQHEAMVRTTSEVTYRTWRLYMATVAHGFEAGYINVNQTLLSKPQSGNCHLPLSRRDIYQS